MPARVAAPYRSPKPNALYTDPTIGATAGNLGTLIFGDPNAVAKRALDEKHGLYFDAAAGNQRAQAELHTGQRQARAGLGGRLAQLGIPQAQADAIGALVEGGGANDSSLHAAQTVNTFLGGQRLNALDKPPQPGMPTPGSPADVQSTELGARIASLLMNGGAHMPTEKTTITPAYQDQQLANAEEGATERTGITADAHVRGQVGAASVAAKERGETERWKVLNSPVHTPQGSTTNVTPAQAAALGVTAPPSGAGTQIFGTPPPGRGGQSKVEDDLRRDAMLPLGDPKGDAARATLNAYTVAGAGGKIATAQVGGDARVAAAETAAAARGQPRALNQLQETKLNQDMRGLIDAKIGVTRGKDGLPNGSVMPLDPAIEDEIATRAVEYTSGAGLTPTAALDRAFGEVTGGAPIKRSGRFGFGAYSTPGGVEPGSYKIPPRTGAAPAAAGPGRVMTPPAQSGAAPTSNAPRVVNSQADYDALQPGTAYVDSAGNKGVKK